MAKYVMDPPGIGTINNIEPEGEINGNQPVPC